MGIYINYEQKLNIQSQIGPSKIKKKRCIYVIIEPLLNDL